MLAEHSQALETIQSISVGHAQRTDPLAGHPDKVLSQVLELWGGRWG